MRAELHSARLVLWASENSDYSTQNGFLLGSRRGAPPALTHKFAVTIVSSFRSSRRFPFAFLLTTRFSYGIYSPRGCHPLEGGNEVNDAAVSDLRVALRKAAGKIWANGFDMAQRRELLTNLRGEYIPLLGEEAVRIIMKECASAHSKKV